MDTTPLPVTPGRTFFWQEKKFVYVGRILDDLLHIDDEVGRPLLVTDEATGLEAYPDPAWFLHELISDRIRIPTSKTECQQRLQRFLHLDMIACATRDPASFVRWMWGRAAAEAALPQSEPKADAFVAANHPLPLPKLSWLHGNRSLTTKLLRLLQVRPSGRSVMRAAKKYRRYNGAIGAFVNQSGRLPGESQLPDRVDRLVNAVVEIYWRDHELSDKEMAGALAVRFWDLLDQAGHGDIGASPPSFEAVRNRINRAETRANWARRYGVVAAEKKFAPSGEPIEVTRPFERIYFDATEFRHYTTFSDEWGEIAGKMKGIYAMDVFSQYVFEPSIFCGNLRPQMARIALMNVLGPRHVDKEDIRSKDRSALIYGIGELLMYDNDKAILPPSSVPGMSTIATTELAAAYHSDAKSILENFFKFPKAKVRGLKGLVMAPRQKRDPRIDPAVEANVTRAEYKAMLEQGRHAWNTTPKTCLNGWTPEEVMLAHIGSFGLPALSPRELHRHLADHPGGRFALTTDGLVYDNVHYRWNPDGTAETLDNNHHAHPFRQRLQDTAKCMVPIRVWNGDIDMIEVLDETTGKYHPMWSTDPEYTGGLSRWEHHHYRDMLKMAGRGPATDRSRIRAKSKQEVLKKFDSLLDELAIRDRAVPMGLIESEEMREAQLAAGTAGAGPVSPHHREARVPDEGREDVPTPPPQSRSTDRKGRPRSKPLKRAEDYGTASTATHTRPGTRPGIRVPGGNTRREGFMFDEREDTRDGQEDGKEAAGPPDGTPDP